MDDIKTKLLGGAEEGPIEASSVPLEADTEALLSPMERPTSIMKLFCSGCGTVYELDKEGAERLAKMAKMELPADTSGWFFKVKGCLACNGPADKITLEKIHVA